MLRPPVSRSPEIGPGFVWRRTSWWNISEGSGGDHASLVLALWALAHGTVELLISKLVPPARAAELREGCRRAVAVLLREAEQKSNGEP